MSLNFFKDHYILHIIYIFVGLGVFLSGIKLMSSSFESIVNTKIKYKINKFTSSKFLGIVVGTVLTGLLQSSSATTLIVITLVHSGILNIYNAVPIIMGANIGTTLTGQLIAFNFTSNTHLFIAIGLISYCILRKTRYRIISKVLISLSLIFLGIDVIKIAVSSFQATTRFTFLIHMVGNNNFLAIFLGFIITAIIQSSSTGIAMLQILASSNLIDVHTSLYILLGQNIGTCVTILLGSIATNRIGKQTAIIHIMFNIFGVLIFYFLIDQLYYLVIQLSPDFPSRQIANAHTIFNISNTIILLPFSNLLVKISRKIISD
ncbi:Na/Pi cotransporter family protein [Dethiothermospora halolimnae]|uniref:Na/Pi cotransporter family protein n=1 Tax=Dethiothermospora halolimnae TaxID=3114390 RepID=UPI003CCBAF3F